MFDSKFILIWSANPDELVKFYTDVLGLKLIEKTDIPAQNGLAKDYGYDLQLSEYNILWIGHHDKIKGKNKDSLRIMFNLDVDGVQKWYEKVNLSPA